MLTATHTVTGVAILLLVSILGAPISPIFVLLVLLAATIPDIDVVLEGRAVGGAIDAHRRGTHTLLFSLLYSLVVTYALYFIIIYYGLNGSIAVMALVLIVHGIYHKKTGQAPSTLAWITFLTIWILIEFRLLTLTIFTMPPFHEAFFASLLGCWIHYAGDLITASGGKRMAGELGYPSAYGPATSKGAGRGLKLFWPLQKEYGTNLLKTGGLGERGIFALSIFIIVLSFGLSGAYFGNITNFFASMIGGPLYTSFDVFNVSFLLALLFGFLALFTLKKQVGKRKERGESLFQHGQGSIEFVIIITLALSFTFSAIAVSQDITTDMLKYNLIDVTKTNLEQVRDGIEYVRSFGINGETIITLKHYETTHRYYLVTYGTAGDSENLFYWSNDDTINASLAAIDYQMPLKITLSGNTGPWLYGLRIYRATTQATLTFSVLPLESTTYIKIKNRDTDRVELSIISR